VAYGLALGTALSLVLVYVINRQSFNWSIDLAIPSWQLAILSLTLIAAAAITAIWSGRAAMSQDAVQAVRGGLVRELTRMAGMPPRRHPLAVFSPPPAAAQRRDRPPTLP